MSVIDKIFFPIFDWLAARGLLSQEGTALDFVVVILVTQLFCWPFWLIIIVYMVKM